MKPTSDSMQIQGLPCSGRNYWVARDESPYASWLAIFPERYVEPREYLDFLHEVLMAASKEEVYRVVRAPLGQYWRKHYPERYWEYCTRSCKSFYRQFMEQAFAETGRIIFLQQVCSYPALLGQYQVLATTRLGYYNQEGQLVESEVEDIGALLRQLRPTEYEASSVLLPEVSEEEKFYRERSIDRQRAHGGAIYFFGSQGADLEKWERIEVWKSLPEGVRKPEDKPLDPEAFLGIKIYTDIWMPQVKGSLERMFHSYKRYNDFPLFDNRELALRHTPRLNRFLQSVKQLIEQRGGRWEYDDSNAPDLYKSMLDEDGIILNI